MSPERQAHRYHVLIRVSIVGIVITSLLVVANIWLWTDRASSQADARANRAELRAARSIIMNDQLERSRAAKVKRANDQAQCRSSIAGTRIADNIILQIRGTLLDLASVSINPPAKAKLLQRASTFQTFPLPKCDAGTSP